MINELLKKETIKLIINEYKNNKSIDEIHDSLNNAFIFQKDIEMKKPLFGYMGGKTRLSQQILKYIPDHQIYIEPFCGSLALLLTKGYKNVLNNDHYREIINDSNENLISFYLNVRDNCQELIDLLDNIEYSNGAVKINESLLDKIDIKKGAYWFIKMLSSFSGTYNKEKTNIAYGKYGRNHVQTFLNKILLVKAFSNRLKNCFIFNEDYQKTVLRFDCKDAFIYFDPPYKNTRQYVGNKFNYNKFPNFVKSLKSKWIISHYYDDYVQENFSEYNIIHLKHSCSMSKAEKGKERTNKKVDECIIMNYDPDKVDLYLKKDKLLFEGLNK